jgi:predicted TIM-barrel fold metal-dependent hydrolase
MKKSIPEPELASPIPFRTGSNGEFVPREATAADLRAEEMFRRLADDHARRLGISRRAFVHSACGTAAALLVINQVYGCGGDDGGNGDGGGGNGDGDGGGFEVDAGSAIDGGQACEELSGPEFVFDVQTHHVNPAGAWRDAGTLWPAILGSFPQASCGDGAIDCYDRNHYIRELFINSDTSVAVLSAVPAVDEENPLLASEAAETREVIEMLSGSSRLQIHGLVMPDLGPKQLDGMEALASELRIAAWKVYTQFGGWWLDDPPGIAFIEKALDLGIDIICAHKGLTLPGFDGDFAGPRDIGVVAAAYPDMRFVAYHSGYETTVTEGPYDAASVAGVDTLVTAMQDNGLAPGSNVYAELGSTWRSVMTSPTEAAHVLGKLLVHVGEDNILWGTDSIWYGSPQDQIAAFRTFQIPEKLREKHGYPQLTDAIRAKILGLNAAALYRIDPEAVLCEIRDDQLSRRRRELAERPAETHRAYGPRTRREFFSFLRSRGGQPG